MTFAEWDKLVECAHLGWTFDRTVSDNGTSTDMFRYCSWEIACVDGEPQYVRSLVGTDSKPIYRNDCDNSDSIISSMSSAELTALVTAAKTELNKRHEEAKQECLNTFMTAWTELKTGFPEVKLCISTHQNAHNEPKPVKQITIKVHVEPSNNKRG